MPAFRGRFEFVSRSKEAVYRQSGEAEYDEAGSPSERPTAGQDGDTGQVDTEPDADAGVTPLHPPRAPTNKENHASA
jgi:hypothetical protein